MKRYLPTKHTNLIRRNSNGEYILSATVQGKHLLLPLDTTDAQVAIVRRNQKLSELQAAPRRSLSDGALSFRQLVQEWLDQLAVTCRVASTLQYNQILARTICQSFKQVDQPVRAISELMLQVWSRDFGLSASRHNHALGMVRTIFALAIRKGLRMDNPALDVKKMKINAKVPILPTLAQFHALVKSMRQGGHRDAQNVADLVEFLAYGGFRQNEAAHILWSDIDWDWDEGRGRIHVRIVKGLSRNSQPRYVPINADMKRFLNTLRQRGVAGPNVTQVRECTRSLTTACAQVGCARFTHHSLRHFFATRAIENGVDIPTVSRWLGHRDGGALAMRIYGHLRDEHSSAMIQKMDFKFAGPSSCRATEAIQRSS